jgi:NAD(P)-dependent dehydrogenase (short-subunit alcohol dehydrogenase family)
MPTVPIYPDNGPYLPASGTIPKPTLVLGAAGELGRAIVGALLAQGRPVIAVDTDRDGLAALPDPGRDAPELVRLVGHTGTETAGAALANAVRLLRRPPGAVVALIGGSWSRGRLLDRPADALREKFDEDLFPHLVAARHLLPLLAESGAPATWLLIGGPAADAPWAGYGHLSVSQAALRMLARVLREETLAGPVRVQQLTVCQPVRTADKQACAGADWPLPVEIGLQVADLVAGTGAEPVVRFDRRVRHR